MPKPWYSIKAAAEGSETAEISILDEIHPWFGVDARSYLAEFRALKAPKVKVYINSPGGSVIEALTIFNGMRATGKEIEVHVLGIAASAASYIAMAGDKIIMPRNTAMLPHKPMNNAGGNADDHRETADLLDKIESMLIPAYMRRWKGTEDELKALLAKDELLTAEECLAHGFCDEVTEEVTATASFDIDLLPPKGRELFEAAAKRTDPPKQISPLADEIATFAKGAGLEAYVACFVSDPTATTLEAAKDIVNRAREVVALAKHAGKPDMADALVRGRKSVQDARAELAAVLEQEDEERHVDTAPRTPKNQRQADPQASWTPTTLWDEIKAMKTGSKQ